MKLTDILKEDYSNDYNTRNKEFDADMKETIYVLLDTYQDGIYTFTGASKSEEGISRLRDKVIARFKITKPEELKELHVFEVPLDEYFDMRAKLDQRIRDAEYSDG